MRQMPNIKCLPAKALATGGQMSSRGSILLEAFIAIMVISLAFGIILDIGTLSVKTSTAIEQSSQANFLLKEAIEATRSFRDGTTWASNGLGNLNTGSNNPYYFSLDTSTNPATWILNQGTETTGIFTRKIIFDNVSRDLATQNIENTYNASHHDPNTKKVTATVSFSGKNSSIITYFTNWR